MEMFVPGTIRQAVWLIVGGVFAFIMGGLRIASYVQHGGILVLVMGLAFVALGVVSVVASATRFRRGEQPRQQRTL
jgi:membrane protein implicated in regulation of membrane protease activity